MKRKSILFLTLLAMTLCVFAIVIGASDIYSNLIEPGENGEKPIVSFLGYSTSEEGAVCVGYCINNEALSNYEKATGTTLKYGLVVARKDSFEGNLPLDSMGEIPEKNKGKVAVVNFEQRIDEVIAILSTLPSEQLDSYLVMSLFVVDSQKGVIYVGKEASSIGPESITFNEIKQGLPPTPAKPIIRETTINGITYSTNGTTGPAWDRIKQMNYSNSVYNTGSYKTDKELKGSGLFDRGILGKAQLIALGGSLINMPAASAFMSHYLKNTGEDYTINVSDFLSNDTGALSNRNKAINNALRAAEQLAMEGETITINQLAEGHPMQNSLATQNWQYAIGSYFDDVDVINLTVTEENGVKTYTADIKYMVTDFYNWDTNDTYKFKQIVSPHELHELHKAGMAKEFTSYGEITYSAITWTEGTDASTIENLK